MKNTIILITALVLSSCSVKTSGVFVNPSIKKYSFKNVVILPFDNNNENSKFRDQYPNAPEIIHEALETAMMKYPLNIIARSQIKNILGEMEFQRTGLTDEKRAEIGKILNAKLIITGKISSFVQGSKPHPVTKKFERTRVGISVSGIHVETGIILFKGNVFQNIDTLTGWNSSVISLANKVVSELVEELAEKGLSSALK